MAADLRERAAVLMAPDRIRGILEAGFAGGAFAIDDCRIIHSRFRTSAAQRREGEPFLSAGYELALRVLGAPAGGRQLLALRAYCDGRARKHFERAKAAHRHPPAYGPPVAHIDELDAVLVVRYKPETHCTTRYRLEDGLVIYGKTLRDRRATEVARVTERLRRQLDRDQAGFIVPRALGASDAVNTVWQLGLPGNPVIEILDPHNYGRLLASVAPSLASLHRIDPRAAAPLSPGDQLRTVSDEAAKPGRGIPAPRIARRGPARAPAPARSSRCSPARRGSCTVTSCSSSSS